MEHENGALRGPYISEYLQGMGYEILPSNLPEFTVFYQFENSFVNVIHVIDYLPTLYITTDQYDHIKEQIKKVFKERGVSNIHLLTLILGEDAEKAKQLSREDAFSWFIDKNNQRLIIYENQAADFYGIKGKLEYWLDSMAEDAMEQQIRFENAGGQWKAVENIEKNFLTTIGEKLSWQSLQRGPFVNYGIILMNIMVFTLCVLFGEIMYTAGDLSARLVMEQGHYYRIFTSMFLHAGVDHLVSNMTILFFLGAIAEKHLGHLRYFLLYFIAGTGGAVFSMQFSYFAGDFTPSVGASGAIFGMIGSLLCLVIMNKGSLEYITLGRIIFMIFYSLYSGIVGTGIDNAAHIGGLVTGFVTTIFLKLLEPKSHKL